MYKEKSWTHNYPNMVIANILVDIFTFNKYILSKKLFFLILKKWE
jgi:hypothetical protein